MRLQHRCFLRIERCEQALPKTEIRRRAEVLTLQGSTHLSTIFMTVNHPIRYVNQPMIAVPRKKAERLEKNKRCYRGGKIASLHGIRSKIGFSTFRAETKDLHNEKGEYMRCLLLYRVEGCSVSPRKQRHDDRKQPYSSVKFHQRQHDFDVLQGDESQR